MVFGLSQRPLPRILEVSVADDWSWPASTPLSVPLHGGPPTTQALSDLP